MSKEKKWKRWLLVREKEEKSVEGRMKERRKLERRQQWLSVVRQEGTWPSKCLCCIYFILRIYHNLLTLNTHFYIYYVQLFSSYQNRNCYIQYTLVKSGSSIHRNARRKSSKPLLQPDHHIGEEFSSLQRGHHWTWNWEPSFIKFLSNSY